MAHGGLSLDNDLPFALFNQVTHINHTSIRTMTHSYLKRISIVWLVLVIATAISFAVEWLLSNGANGLSKTSIFAIIIITFIKVRYVILDFMELRDAPWVLRLTNELWIITVGVMLCYMWWS